VFVVVAVLGQLLPGLFFQTHDSNLRIVKNLFNFIVAQFFRKCIQIDRFFAN